MTVGVYTRYAQCDEAYFALRLAELGRHVGGEVSIFSETIPAKLGSGYDKKILSRRNLKFTDWAKNKRAIVWTHVPSIEQINFTRRVGAAVILVPMWQDLKTPFRRSMRAADVVVALSMECRDLYKSIYKFKNVSLLPFDVGLPHFRKEKTCDPKLVKLFLPWFDKNARCTHIEFLAALRHIMLFMPETHLTVGVSSCHFSPNVGKFFKRLNARTGRVTVKKNVSFLARPELYAQNDLTIFTGECDNYGFCPLTSIACGTPVVSFGVSPQTDFIYPTSNGVLVKTSPDYDENGVPHANPDYSKFFETVQALIAEPKHIEHMNTRIAYNLSARKKAFELGWQNLLGLA